MTRSYKLDIVLDKTFKEIYDAYEAWQNVRVMLYTGEFGGGFTHIDLRHAMMFTDSKSGVTMYRLAFEDIYSTSDTEFNTFANILSDAVYDPIDVNDDTNTGTEDAHPFAGFIFEGAATDYPTMTLYYGF